MSARTTEKVQIRSPIKKQIKHLDGESRKKFPELLEEVVRRLQKNGFKLIHGTKSYRKKNTVCSDNFWRKETRVKNIKIIWLCKFTIVFDKGFEFNFDFDYWFEYSKFLQNLRSEIYQTGFPFTSRDYAKKFGKKEATRALKEIEKEIGEKMKTKINGWGEHGIKKKITDRKSLDICHRKEFTISILSELDKLRNYLPELIEEPIEIIKNSKNEINEVARRKLKELIPFTIEPNSIEGYLAFFLWFRKPGGGFEYQLYRFIQENYGRIVDKEEIRDALLRLEVHGYVNVKETPKETRKKLEKQKIRRCRRFYETGKEQIPGQKLFQKLKSKADIGAYLTPLPKKRLVKMLNAPNHLVNKKIKELTRKNYLTERKVKNYLGRTVRKIKPKKRPRNPTRLEKRIMKKTEKFYDTQKNSLDRIQKERP